MDVVWRRRRRRCVVTQPEHRGAGGSGCVYAMRATGGQDVAGERSGAVCVADADGCGAPPAACLTHTLTCPALAARPRALAYSWMPWTCVGVRRRGPCASLWVRACGFVCVSCAGGRNNSDVARGKRGGGRCWRRLANATRAPHPARRCRFRFCQVSRRRRMGRGAVAAMHWCRASAGAYFPPPTSSTPLPTRRYIRSLPSTTSTHTPLRHVCLLGI